MFKRKCMASFKTGKAKRIRHDKQRSERFAIRNMILISTTKAGYYVKN